jgi:uncharacterized membrane protein (Fun14 family)
MYSVSNTQKGKNMKFFAIALGTALAIVGVHFIIGWIAYNAPLLTIILLMTGFAWFVVALLDDLGVITIDLSKVFKRTSR